VKHKGLRAIVVLEGRDTAGKGRTIKAISVARYRRSAWARSRRTNELKYLTRVGIRPGTDRACQHGKDLVTLRTEFRFLLAATVVALGGEVAGAAEPVRAELEAGPAATSQSVVERRAPTSPGALERSDVHGDSGRREAPAETATPPQQGSAAGRFVRDVGGDYKHFFSKETAYWYSGGLAAAGLVHLADEDIAEELGEPSATTRALEGGDKYGNLTMQVPLAVGWWIVGHMAGSARGADAGRDLVRAQISAMSWAYAWKYAVDRTRPNGDPRSFPSGHAAATFATSMVLQDHYGWKVGVPFFAASTYTAISRLTINKHWASDVTFGAFVGIASARTVTLHLRNRKFALVPLATPGGGGLALTRVD
jgi:hypothetical protein